MRAFANVRCFVYVFGIFFLFAFLYPNVAVAKSVKVNGSKVWLDEPDSPKASLILVPGGGGLSDNDPLQRLRKKLAAKGFAVLSIDGNTRLRPAAMMMSKIAKPVYVAAVSKGVMTMGNVLASGRFKGKKLVLVAGDLKFLRKRIGSPDNLPQTLIIHHRSDGCRKTPPSAVSDFKKWAGGKVKVVWLKGGRNRGNPCGPDSYHGLNGLGDEVVSAIVDFLQ